MTSTGRVVCPRCGANNFDTVNVCWKCQAPLTTSSSLPPTPPSALEMPRYAAPAPTLAGDEGVAKRAALWLALTLPYVGLPIGWAFMMMSDNRQRQQIGRFCVIWSSIALIFHLLLLFVGTEQLVSLLSSLPTLLHNVQGGTGTGGLGGLGANNLP